MDGREDVVGLGSFEDVDSGFLGKGERKLSAEAGAAYCFDKRQVALEKCVGRGLEVETKAAGIPERPKDSGGVVSKALLVENTYPAATQIGLAVEGVK